MKDKAQFVEKFVLGSAEELASNHNIDYLTFFANTIAVCTRRLQDLDYVATIQLLEAMCDMISAQAMGDQQMFTAAEADRQTAFEDLERSLLKWLDEQKRKQVS